MKRLAITVCTVGLLVAPTSFAQDGAQGQPPPVENVPDCTTAQDCVRILAEYRIAPPPASGAIPPNLDRTPFARAYERLRVMGEAGTDAIMPLLEHDNPYVRQRASYVLWSLPAVNARHTAALIKAQRAGVVGLEPAIGRTGTNEAMGFLWAKVLSTRTRLGSESGVIIGLDQFGARAGPMIGREMDRCRDGVASPPTCLPLLPLLMRNGQPQAAVQARWETIARSPKAAPEVREAAADLLIRQGHPAAIEFTIQKLQTVLARPGSNAEVDALVAIRGLTARGTAAVSAGPVLAGLLDAKTPRRIRLAATRAVGQIGYGPAVAALIAQRPEFTDDWELAYNAAESLGRLGAGEAVLTALARDHWYRPVRNNAARALNLMQGEGFAAPVDAADFRIVDGPLGLQLRHPADMPLAIVQSQSRCWAMGSIDYDRPDAPLAWPAQASDGPVTLALKSPDAGQRQALFASHPRLKIAQRRRLVFATRLGGQWLIGTDEGEWGGEVAAPDDGETPRVLIGENAIAAVPIKDGLVVFTGLSHMFSRGDLWIVGEDAAGPQVRRRVRLPTEPSDFRMVWPKMLVFTTGGQEVAVDQSGELSDASRLAGCGR